MGSFGPLEIFLIFLVVLLIFGANRIPEIARGLGKGIREFKDATSDITRELDMEDQRRQIQQPRAPQHGAPQARGSYDDAPPQPARADHPGDARAAQPNASAEARPQQQEQASS
jgi:sec-independent protein translocase protein TatA